MFQLLRKKAENSGSILSVQNGFDQVTADTITQISNSWDLGFDITEEDFISLDPNDPGFLRLAPDSDLIDAGTGNALDFNGSAPDLGAFEAEESTAQIRDENDPSPLDDSTLVETTTGSNLERGTEDSLSVNADGIHMIDLGKSANEVNQIIATAAAGD